jgi:hypothetical protein
MASSMALLNRFRPQPPQKHPDPAVRLAYVEDIPLDDREAILAMAREDEDPRVRKAAVAKLMDPAGLSEIARTDRDEHVRSQAADMLRDIALEVFEGVGENESLDAVDALSDGKALGHVAKTAGREIVALRALSRISDAHSLGSVARHAALEAARRGAFELLRERGDRGELFGVAMNGEFKDTALLAVDILANPEALEQIATRGKNKAAAKRARTILREAEERQAREAAEREAERLSSARLEADVAEAVQLKPDTTGTSTEDTSSVRLEADLEATRLQQQLEIEQKLESERRQEAERLQRDAERQQREAEAREAAARSRREALASLQQLLARIEPIAAKTDATLKALERALHDVRAALADIPPLPSRNDFEEISGRLKAAQAALQPKADELREADDWQRWANAGIQEQLCARMEALRTADDPDAILRAVREMQDQWRQVSRVPRAQAEPLWRRFKAAHDEVWTRCEAHFSAQAQARGEYLAKKIALCEKAEALTVSTHWIQTAEEIKRLQAEWKTVGPASRGREKAVWERFRTACDTFFTRRHDDLVQRKALWAENLTKKDALCVRAEALAESAAWDETREEIKRLQAEWKTIGPVKKSRSEAIWQRFRTATDRFFTRYAERQNTARAERAAVAREAADVDLSANIARMESLVARIEELEKSLAAPAAGARRDDSLSPTVKLAAMLKDALAANTIGGKTVEDGRGNAALEDVRQAQGNWSRIGPVPDEVRRPLVDRFQRACRRITESSEARRRTPASR